MTTSLLLEASDFIIFYIKKVLGLFGVYFPFGISTPANDLLLRLI